MKTHLHVGYSAVGLLLSPVLQSAGHRQEVLLQLLGRDGLWASFISGGLYRYISNPSSGRAIGAPGSWTPSGGTHKSCSSSPFCIPEKYKTTHLNKALAKDSIVQVTVTYSEIICKKYALSIYKIITEMCFCIFIGTAMHFYT